MIHDFDKSSIEMMEWSCVTCGCVQWMPEEHNDQLQKTHRVFYCINGHGNVYNTKTDIEEIQGKLMNEYSKNAQLEKRLAELEEENKKPKKSVFNRIFKS